MKRIVIIFFMLLASTICQPAFAKSDDAEEEDAESDDSKEADEEADDGTAVEKTMYVGGYFSMGLTTMLGDGYAEWQNDISPQDKKLAFSHGSSGYFDYYFTPMLGIHVGLGFLTKGIRYKWTADGDEFLTKERFVFMEVPAAFKINVEGLQVAMGFALWVALGAKRTTVADATTTETKWTHDGDPFWGELHRVNVGPWINIGYAIEVGPIEIVPSITWMLHLINDLKNDGIPQSDGNFQLRAMNIMFNSGFQWGF